ncbi:hypothetical protein O3P69_009860 [Scylla paramamosain]|uniref:Uncharacterized protein n=1 Tax=Scylla paramamosain TaxID=85552 RepID=A0AAW0SNW4_SCYPA
MGHSATGDKGRHHRVHTMNRASQGTEGQGATRPRKKRLGKVSPFGGEYRLAQAQGRKPPAGIRWNSVLGGHSSSCIHTHTYIQELLASSCQWSRSEMAMQLDLELLVRRAYPEASNDMVTILLRDQFVDAIDHQQMRIYVQQAHPKDLQEALARGLELESFLRTTRELPNGNYAAPHKVKARKGRMGTPPPSSSPHLGRLRGKCFSGEQMGHSKKYCPVTGRSSVPTSQRATASRPRETSRGWRKGSDGRQSGSPTPQAAQVAAPLAPGPFRWTGKWTLAALDSGGERTFVQEGVLATRQPLVAKQQLCGISGHCTQLKGPVEARIEVGGPEEHLPIYVADVGESLLGFDFLQQSKAVLDFGEMTVEVGDNVVPLQEGCGADWSWKSRGRELDLDWKRHKGQRGDAAGRQTKPAAVGSEAPAAAASASDLSRLKVL